MLSNQSVSQSVTHLLNSVESVCVCVNASGNSGNDGAINGCTTTSRSSSYAYIIGHRHKDIGMHVHNNRRYMVRLMTGQPNTGLFDYYHHSLLCHWVDVVNRFQSHPMRGCYRYNCYIWYKSNLRLNVQTKIVTNGNVQWPKCKHL